MEPTTKEASKRGLGGRPRSTVPIKLLTFRFYERDLELLTKLANKLRLAKSAVVRYAIARIAEEEGVGD